ncbi:DNA circularization protein [Herminiimonas arsenitoxidans]|uniref:DNA circularization protein n=1 Tax=Herminiimonas arsenitoxidans TaxID=1809410 RepID=UPI0009709FE6|nr:DNA circularization N-terminal domain-containing protein [Herminiimonas arsenitoxidans]
MSWEKLLLPASFKGIEFPVVRIFDDIARSVVADEYAYVDGANTKDLGRFGRRTYITSIIYGDNYEAELQTLIAKLDEADSGTLVHPIFGVIEAQFVRAGFPHEATEPDQCRFTLEFLENSLGGILFDRVLPIQTIEAINQAADETTLAAGERFVRDILSKSLPALLREQLSSDLLGVMDKLQDYASLALDAREFVVSGLHYLANPTAFVDELTGGMVSRIKALFSPMDLRLGSSSDDSIAYNGIGSVWSGPVADIQRPLIPVTDVAATDPVLVTHVCVQQAVAVAGCAAQLFDRALDADVLTPNDIETVAADTRTALNVAIALVVATYPDIVQSRPITEPLKRLALSVSDAAEKLIMAKPPLIDRVVETPGNLHLLAHIWFDDYARADELLRLNPQITNPNFIRLGSTLRAYAV